MTLQAEARLGPYEILAPLGAGGMGEVYRARDTRLGREVAVKVLPSEVASDPERLRRFEQEARAASALSHPNILTLFDVGRHEETSFLVTELLEGETLRARLAAGPLPLRKAIELGIAVARGLAAAHAKGIVHRDLKPENLFLTRDGGVKILDFGLAKRIRAAVENATDFGAAPTIEELTLDGTVLGTIGYMAPEQVRGEPADARSDLFALGCVLYELLTGARAFRGATAADTLSAILRDEPAPFATGESGRAISPALDRIVRHCLEKNPAERFHSARDLAFDLEALAPTLPPTTSLDALPPARRRSPRPLLLGAAGLLAAATLAVVIVALVRSRSAPQSVSTASLAVLPFVNMSSDPEQEYFSDGLAEEMLDLLSQIPHLHVAGRTSSFSFKGKNEDLRTIGQKLNVATVLEGSVRKSGQQLRVTAQLINVADGFHLWSHTYDRTLTDIFALQDEIAGAVVAALKIELLPGERAPRAQRRKVDPEAYNQYLLGRSLLSRADNADRRPALDALEKAVARDPEFAPAHAALAEAAFNVADWLGDSSSSIAAGYRRALAEADRALKLDPELAEGYATRGTLRRIISWDWPGAESDFRRALELDPEDGMTSGEFGFTLGVQRHSAEAIRLAKRGTEIDPLSPRAWRILGDCLEWDGQLVEARRAWERELELYPEDGRARYRVGMLALRERSPAVALAEFDRVSNEAFRLQGRTLALDALGRHAEAESVFEEYVEKHGFHAAFEIAEVYALRNDRDRAFEWLDRAYAWRDSSMPMLAVNSEFTTVRDDPRFLALVRKMNLPTAK